MKKPQLLMVVLIASIMTCAVALADEQPAPDPSNPYERILRRVTPMMVSKTGHTFSVPRQVYDGETQLDPVITDDMLRFRRRGYFAGTYPVKWNPFINRS